MLIVPKNNNAQLLNFGIRLEIKVLFVYKTNDHALH